DLAVDKSAEESRNPPIGNPKYCKSFFKLEISELSIGIINHLPLPISYVTLKLYDELKYWQIFVRISVAMIFIRLGSIPHFLNGRSITNVLSSTFPLPTNSPSMYALMWLIFPIF